MFYHTWVSTAYNLILQTLSYIPQWDQIFFVVMLEAHSSAIKLRFFLFEVNLIILENFENRHENICPCISRKNSILFTFRFLCCKFNFLLDYIGLFRLYNLIISQVINHVTCYRFKCSHWLKYSLQSECCNFSQWEESNL